MLLDYIPPFLREIVELKKLFSALENEIAIISSFQKEVFDGQFIFYCDLKYIQKFEDILGIVDMGGYTNEERRKKIIIKFNEKLPYTVFRFKESLNIICGNDNYFLFIIYSQYRLVLRIKTNNKMEYKEVISLVDRMVPANMETTVVCFNTHEVVGRFKHCDLERFTHSQIYSEILSIVNNLK